MHNATIVWRRLAAILVCLAFLSSLGNLQPFDSSIPGSDIGALKSAATIKLMDRAKAAFDGSRTQSPGIDTEEPVSAAEADLQPRSRLLVSDAAWRLLSAAVRVELGRAPPSRFL